jgi:hypothetical protein
MRHLTQVPHIPVHYISPDGVIKCRIFIVGLVNYQPQQVAGKFIQYFIGFHISSCLHLQNVIDC